MKEVYSIFKEEFWHFQQKYLFTNKRSNHTKTRSQKEGLVIKPVKVIHPDQVYFYTPEWQKKEAEADDAIAKGEVLGPFDNAKDAIKALKKGA